ncbi:hypothetical protein LTS12_028189, partial [Elasticomyces elasticus]
MSSPDSPQVPVQDARNESSARDRNADEVAPLKQIKPNLEVEESKRQSPSSGHDNSQPLKDTTNAATRPIENQTKNEGRRVSGAYKNSNELEKGLKRGG